MAEKDTSRLDPADLDAQQLQVLASIPGALRIITNEVHPDFRADKQDRRAGARDGIDLRDPHFLVHQDVVRIDGPNHLGLYTAFAADGSWCAGRPGALLKRLQEWRTSADVPTPADTDAP